MQNCTIVSAKKIYCTITVFRVYSYSDCIRRFIVCLNEKHINLNNTATFYKV
jgi:hypothetical protein